MTDKVSKGIPIDFKVLEDKLWLVAIGIEALQRYSEIGIYLDMPEIYRPMCQFIRNGNKCEIKIVGHNDNWVGASYEVPISETGLVDLYPWITQFSKLIITRAYSFVDEDITGLVDNGGTVKTKLSNFKSVDHGLQFRGQIACNKSGELVAHSAKYVFNLYQLPAKPMLARVGDTRIGYFYEKIEIDEKSRSTGDPIILINRKNLDKAPWVYIVDRSIPLRYHQAVKSGILSWNNYFAQLGLGQPFKVKAYGDADYPETVDPFDMNAWYAVNTNIDKFNGPYSGYSGSINDIRSGENLLGIISLNFVKITSNPIRFMLMDDVKNTPIDDKSPLTTLGEKYISMYISWVVAHEVGHQLGLRHNFMGSIQRDGYGSVMDYIDIFNSFSNMRFLDIYNIRREYHLRAIEYGYKPLSNEISGVKHPELNVIAGQSTVQFGTDENNWESINPMIGTIEDNPDPLVYVEKTMATYRRYRKNLMKSLTQGEISSYKYNTLFINMYNQKYFQLISICLKYIGGRVYSNDRTNYMEIQQQSVYKAIGLILRLLEEVEYTDDEYNHIIYDFVVNYDHQKFNLIKLESVYAMNVSNLHHLYQKFIIKIFESFTSSNKLLRSLHNHWDGRMMDNNSIIDILVNFTFAYKGNKIYDISDVDGIFPEIGAILADDDQWQEKVMDFTPPKYIRQHGWIRQLVKVVQSKSHYHVKHSAKIILDHLSKAINDYVLPFVKVIDRNYQIKKFWRQPQTKMMAHWTLMNDLIHTHTKQ